jgi:HK97 family phage prohead protease
MSARFSDGAMERRASLDARMVVADRKLRGMAVVFHSESLDLGGFREIILPGAVDRTLREGLDVRALVDHETSKVIGRTTAGTLALRKTRRGLEVEIDPPDTSYARDLMESVSRGDISGMSFGFRVVTDEWRMQDGDPIREVQDMIISEVSVVSFPAYEATSVQVAQRSLQAFLQADPCRLEQTRRRHQLQVLR